MEGLVTQLNVILTSPQFLANLSSDPDQLEQVLSAREDRDFDAAWMSTFARVEPLVLDEEHAGLVRQLRKDSFKAAFAISESSEIAGFVSDDFELIAKSSFLTEGGEFARFLMNEYKSGSFPHQCAESSF